MDALEQARTEYADLYESDVRAFPDAYDAKVRENPRAYAMRITDGLDVSEVRRFIREFKAEMRLCARLCGASPSRHA